MIADLPDGVVWLPGELAGLARCARTLGRRGAVDRRAGVRHEPHRGGVLAAVSLGLAQPA